MKNSEQCTWCLFTVENFWYKTVWKEFAANQRFKLLCIDRRQSTGALTSGKPGWNFTSDILENPSLVILVLIHTVTARWLGLKTQKKLLSVHSSLYRKSALCSEILCGSWWNTNPVRMVTLAAVWSLCSVVSCCDSILEWVVGFCGPAVDEIRLLKVSLWNGRNTTIHYLQCWLCKGRVGPAA